MVDPMVMSTKPAGGESPMSHVWDFVEGQGTGVDRHDVTTWTNDRWQPRTSLAPDRMASGDANADTDASGDASAPRAADRRGSRPEDGGAREGGRRDGAGAGAGAAHDHAERDDELDEQDAEDLRPHERG